MSFVRSISSLMAARTLILPSTFPTITTDLSSRKRAIIDYVDAAFDGPPLVPTDPEALRRSDSWTSMITSVVELLLIRQYVFAYFFPTGVGGEPDRAAIEALMPKIVSILDVLEGALATGELGQGAFGRVDAYLVPILFYANTMPEGAALIAARSQLSSYLERGLARPSVQATRPPPLPAEA